MRLLYQLLEDKKHKEFVHLLSLGKIVSFMVKKILYLFYISCSFTLVVSGIKYLAKLTNSQEPEPHVFAPWSRKKISGAGATGEKIKSRSRLGKK